MKSVRLEKLEKYNAFFSFGVLSCLFIVKQLHIELPFIFVLFFIVMFVITEIALFVLALKEDRKLRKAWAVMTLIVVLTLAYFIAFMWK